MNKFLLQMIGICCFSGLMVSALHAKVAVPLLNADFEGQGGWETSKGTFPELSHDAHSGRKAAKITNGMIKTFLLPVTPGCRYQFEAWVKNTPGKYVDVDMAFFGDKRQWLKTGSGLLAQGNSTQWHKISAVFHNRQKKVRFVALQFHGGGLVDDVKFWQLKPAVVPKVAVIADEDGLPVFTRREQLRQREDIPFPNGGFEMQGGWESGNGKPLKLVSDAHSGKKSCRLKGGLAKTILIPLEQGEDLFFEAYTKVDDLRTITAEMAFFGEKRQWLKRGSAPLARGDQYAWQKITGHFENIQPDVHYVCLQFYGHGVLDDVKLWKMQAPAPTGDTEKAIRKIELPRNETSKYYFIANNEFEAWISKKTGMLIRLDSLNPARKTIQPAGANSMQLYMHTRNDNSLDGDFNRVKTVKQNNGVLCFTLTSTCDALNELAEAELSYRFKDGRLEISADVIAKRSDSRAFKLGLRNVFRPKEWSRSLFITHPTQPRNPATAISVAYLNPANNSSTLNLGYSNLPFAVLEGSDRFLLWGNHDLGKFTNLTPNDVAWRLPSMQYNPNFVKAGHKWRFDSVYAVFPKLDNDLTQVMRNYLDNVYSSHPESKDLFKRQDFRNRYFTKGAFAWYHPGAIPPGYDGWRQAMLDRHSNNVWYSWWADWNEVYPTTGEWYTYDLRKLSAKGIKKEIDYMKSKDLNVYLYFRQFLAEEGCYTDKPPYKHWLGRNEEGKRQPFIDFPVRKPELLGGVKFVRWTLADFGAADFREWYLDMVKKAVDFYQPTGLCWDMIANSHYSRNNPDFGYGQGILWVQAKVFQYLREKYPDMRIATNESYSSPTALFGDSILIEGAWDVVPKTELDYMLAKGFDATVFSLQLADDYAIQGAPEISLAPFSHIEVTARAENLTAANILGRNIFQSGFKANGKWQTVKVPLDPKRTGIRIHSIRIQTGTRGNGVFELAGAKLISMKNPAIEKVLYDGNSRAEDMVIFSKWQHHTPIPGKVEKIANGLRFTAADPNGIAGDWWNISSVSAKWIKYALKTLGLGAICSDSQLPAMQEFNAFAAELAAMRHLSVKKLIYDIPARVYGTFWGRDEKCAGAIYNDSGKEKKLVLRLKREAFHDNGKALSCGKLFFRMVDPSGKMRPAADFRLSPGKEFLILEGSLKPGHLLVISNWK